MASSPTALTNLPGYSGISPGRATEGQLADIENAISKASSLAELKTVLQTKVQPYVNITDEHVDLIVDLGKAWGRAVAKKLSITDNDQIEEYEINYAVRKLRQLYVEVIRYDLRNGTATSGYIPANVIQASAQDNLPTDSEASLAEHGVRHRASLTSVVRTALGQIQSILVQNGHDPADVSLYDFGSGTGKPALIARQEYKFGKVVGIDYFGPLVNIAIQNAHTLGFKGDRSIKFEFADAGTYIDFRGDVIVCYAYNPFDEVVMEKVVRNLEATGKPVIFAYNKPLNGKLFTPEKGWQVEWGGGDPHDEDSQIMIFTRGFKEAWTRENKLGPPPPPAVGTEP